METQVLYMFCITFGALTSQIQGSLCLRVNTTSDKPRLQLHWWSWTFSASLFILFQLFLCWQGSVAFVTIPARINVTVQRKTCLSPLYQATHHIHLNQLCNPKLGCCENPPLRLTLWCHHCISSYPVCLVAITALVRNTFTGKTAFLKKSLLYSENSLCKFTLWLFLELLIFCAMNNNGLLRHHSFHKSFFQIDHDLG